jgi:peptide deformylase
MPLRTKTERVDGAFPDDYVACIMTIRPLIILPDPLLKQRSEPVATVDAAIKALAADMLDTMYDAPGIGLAAIQIGVARRVVTIDLAKEGEPKAPMVLINPEVTWASDETKPWNEGCLSIPEYYEDVERPDRIRVRFMDLDGKHHEIEADDLLSVCIQHEIDHLNGVMFIDHLSKLKRDRCVKKFAKAAKREG